MNKRDLFTRLIASFMPKRLRYWVTMQVLADTTEHLDNPHDVKLSYILDNAPRPKDLR